MKSLSKVRATAGRSGAEKRWGGINRPKTGRLSARLDVCAIVNEIPIERRVEIVSDALRVGLTALRDAGIDWDSVAVDYGA